MSTFPMPSARIRRWTSKRPKISSLSVAPKVTVPMKLENIYAKRTAVDVVAKAGDRDFALQNRVSGGNVEETGIPPTSDLRGDGFVRALLFFSWLILAQDEAGGTQ